MNRIKSLGFSVAFSLYLCSPVAAAPLDDDALGLLNSSGAGELYSRSFSSISLSTEATGSVASANYSEQFNSAALEEIGAISLENRRYLANWYQSPLGGRYAEVYRNSLDSLVDIEGVFTALSDQRKQLITNFVDDTKMVDSAIKMSESVFQSMTFAMNAADPVEERLSAEQIARMSVKNEAMMRNFLRDQMIKSYAVVLKDFSQDEILVITQAMSSEAYGQFDKALNVAYTDVLAVWLFDMGPEFAKQRSLVAEDMQRRERKTSTRPGSCSAPKDAGISHQMLLD